MKNWLTSLFGILAASSQVVAYSATGTLHDIVTYVGAAALAVLGIAAKDKSNTGN